MPYSIVGKIESRSRRAKRAGATELLLRGGRVHLAKNVRTLVTVRCIAGISCVGRLGPNSTINSENLVLYGARVLLRGTVIHKKLPLLRFNRREQVLGVYLGRREGKSLVRRQEARAYRREGRGRPWPIDADWESIMISSGSSLAVAMRDLLS